MKLVSDTVATWSKRHEDKRPLFINKKVIGEPGESYVGGMCVAESNWRRGLWKTVGGESEL